MIAVTDAKEHIAKVNTSRLAVILYHCVPVTHESSKPLHKKVL
jgi:hypothetical protein